jgi:hypothetical protein
MRRYARPLIVTLSLLGLAGCVDMFTPVMESNATSFAGTSDDGFRRPDCPKLAMNVAVDRSEVTQVERIAGRAQMAEAEPGWAARNLRTLWIEGSIDADQTAEFELRAQQPYDPGVKHYELWRGTRAPDGTLTLREPQPSCGRSVVLARQTAAEGGP